QPTWRKLPGQQSGSNRRAARRVAVTLRGWLRRGDEKLGPRRVANGDPATEVNRLNRSPVKEILAQAAPVAHRAWWPCGRSHAGERGGRPGAPVVPETPAAMIAVPIHTPTG